MTASVVGVGVLVLIALWAMVTNSRLIRARNMVDEARRLLDMQLGDEHAASEQEVAAARESYEAAVRTYNRRIRVFPNRLVAGRYFRPV